MLGTACRTLDMVYSRISQGHFREWGNTISIGLEQVCGDGGLARYEPYLVQL